MSRTIKGALDITVATRARARYAMMLSNEDRQRLSALTSTDELIAYLARTESWHGAMSALPIHGATDEQFAAALDEELTENFEALYRLASDSSKDFLSFLTLDEELRAVTDALRRLTTRESAGVPAVEETAPKLMHGRNPARFKEAKSIDELIEMCGDSIYGKALRANGRANGNEYRSAVLMLESEFNRELARYLKSNYSGTEGRTLINTVTFRVDMLNITYLLRLRRFNTPADKALELLIPLQGELRLAEAQRILSAETDEEAIAALSATKPGRRLKGLGDTPPELIVAAAEEEYYRGVMRGVPSLCTVYAFLRLKELEAAMLKRVFVALRYGMSPERYILLRR